MPRHERLIAQLSALERTTSRVGKDTISHPPNGHDDVANAVAGAAATAGEYQYHPNRWGRGDPVPDDLPRPGYARLPSFWRGYTF